MENNSKKKSKYSSEKIGFYVVLALSITIFAITGTIVTRNNAKYQKEAFVGESNKDIVENAKENIIVNEKTQQKEQAEVQKPIEIKAVDSKTENKTDDTKNEELKEVKTENIRLMLPVSGEIIVPFSKDNLVYSKTMEDFRSHLGIDIKANVSAPVKASYDGIVKKIYKDDKLGITILIEHNKSLSTKYSNLSTDSMVKLNQKVKMGDVISGVGETAIFESADSPHLHFEVLLNNIQTNPNAYLIK